MAASSLFHCMFCGERIGVDERVVVVEHDGEHRETSLAGDPELAERTRTFLIHANCAAALEGGLPNQQRGRLPGA